MMPVIENHADLSGRIESVGPHPTLPGYRSVRVRVDRADSVAGFPNLLQSLQGQVASVSIPDSAVDAGSLVPGKTLHCRAQLSGPGQVFSFADVATSE